ncbi:MAG: hypothetical protein H6R09_878 [Proteobacteria bacterium]|nr:hypothetical protein [Pseudomonadota bacterium]
MNAPMDYAPHLLATLKDAFGEYPDDVLLQMRIAVDTFDQLDALFPSIKAALECADRPRDQAIRLASVGAYLASDVADLVGYARDIYRDCLLSNGIECTEGGR